MDTFAATSLSSLLFVVAFSMRHHKSAPRTRVQGVAEVERYFKPADTWK